MRRNNIILIVLDAVRPDHLGCYGHHRETTPNLDKIATESVVYENAFANSNWTGTSHASLFNGMLPSHSGIYGKNQEIPDEIPMLAERLKQQGYATFATSAGVNLRSERGYNRGFDRFDETFRIRPNWEYVKQAVGDIPSVKQALFTVTRGHDKYSNYKFNSLKRWIDKTDGPFFSFINAKTAHNPYNPPRPYKSMFCNELERPSLEVIERAAQRLGQNTQNVPGEDTNRLRSLSEDYPIIADEISPTERELEVIRQWYDGAVRYLDDQIGALMTYLEDKNLDDKTTVIITADHGELFGEYGLEKHRYSLVDDLIQVPLIIDKGDGTGRRVMEPVSLLDLHPTILDIASVDYDEFPYSESLRPYGDELDHDYLYAEVGSKSKETVRRRHPEFDGTPFDGPLQSIRSDQFKLTRYPDESVNLYEWRNGNDRHDLSEDKPEVTERLETKLLEELNQMEKHHGSEDVNDPHLEQKLKDLGYL